MQKLTAKQFFNLLLLLSDCTPFEMAKELNTSKATVERWIRDTSVNTRKLGDISAVIGRPIYIEMGPRRHQVEKFNRYIPILHKRKGLTVEQAALKIGMTHAGLKARIERNSCMLAKLIEHFKLLNEPLIFIINQNKYFIK